MPNFGASGVIPTINRSDVLSRTLASLQKQDWQPEELIVIDASRDAATRELIQSRAPDFLARGCRLSWQRATLAGAASQRNQGVAAASKPVIWFFDDDILLEPHCVARLWVALCSDAKLGGVNAMIVNQQYQPPGTVSRFMFRMMAGKKATSYAGRVIGPGLNLLPEDRDDLPEVVPVEWLNTTCTLYRREALPDPVFSNRFTGYSIGEDLALSLTVGRRWKLANARTARIIHDSQSGSHKDDVTSVARMAFGNRYFIMVDVLDRRKIGDRVKFAFWEFFQLILAAVQHGPTTPFWQTLWGKVLACNDIWFGAQRA